MQAWLKTTDYQRPVLETDEKIGANAVNITIQTDEPIFQKKPFVAVKDIYEQYLILDCTSSGINRWETVVPMSSDKIVKVGIAVTDSAGNQNIKILRYLPEDIFIDNSPEGITPETDNYSLISTSAWGRCPAVYSIGW